MLVPYKCHLGWYKSRWRVELDSIIYYLQQHSNTTWSNKSSLTFQYNTEDRRTGFKSDENGSNGVDSGHPLSGPAGARTRYANVNI